MGAQSFLQKHILCNILEMSKDIMIEKNTRSFLISSCAFQLEKRTMAHCEGDKYHFFFTPTLIYYESNFSFFFLIFKLYEKIKVNVFLNFFLNVHFRKFCVGLQKSTCLHIFGIKVNVVSKFFY